jgi:hypothetical protein
VNETIDESVSKFLILELLAEDKCLDQQVDLFSVASSVPHILTAEYPASVHPLHVKCKDSWVVVGKWNSPLLTLLPMFFGGRREVRGLLAKQVFVYCMLVLVRPDDYGQCIDTIAFSASDKYK